MKKDKDYKLTISKSPELNAMRNGYPTLREQRILATYLARINPCDPETRTIRFTFEEFADLCNIKDVRGMKKSDYNKIAKGLLKPVSLRTFTGGYFNFVLFSSNLVEENNETGERYIEMSASLEGMQFLFELKRYIKFDLKNVLALKSLNQIRLYEILKEHEWRKSFDIKLDDLRALLFIDPSEYPLFKIFNRDVLSVCQKAINELTDITFTYTTKRTGRKISTISFYVIPKSKAITSKSFPADDGQITLFDDGDIVIKSPINEPKPTKKRYITKKDIEEAKQNELWYFANELAQKKVAQDKKITVSPEKYAVGIMRNWIEKGYKAESDLRENGEINHDISQPSFDIEKFNKKVMEKYKKI
jgi:plasmid replication initiation protein